MESPRILRLELEVELGSRPIRGSVGRGDGSSSPFSGRMSLMHAVDDALAQADAESLPLDAESEEAKAPK